MVLIAIILLASFIVVPIVDLCINERFRTGIKVIIYLLVLLYAIIALVTGRVPV